MLWHFDTSEGLERSKVILPLVLKDAQNIDDGNEKSEFLRELSSVIGHSFYNLILQFPTKTLHNVTFYNRHFWMPSVDLKINVSEIK